MVGSLKLSLSNLENLCQDDSIVGPIPGDFNLADLRWDLDT